MDLYQEDILEHFRHPHNAGRIDPADIIQKEHNTTCGDQLTFYLKFENNHVKKVSFEGEGCAISQAAASMLTDEIQGMSIEEIQRLKSNMVIDLLGVELSPTRLKCALLSLQGISHAVHKFSEQ